MTTIPLASPSLATSSDLPEGVGRAILVFPGASSAGSPSYLVLLRAGFCLPPVLPPARCALTAPFHPYSSTRAWLAPDARSERYVFCATVLQVTLTGRYPAHCPAEFGLSSLERCTRNTQRRSSGSLRTRNCTSTGGMGRMGRTGRMGRIGGMGQDRLSDIPPVLPIRLSCPTIHRPPALSGTARAFCRDC